MTLSMSSKSFDRFVRTGFVERAIEVAGQRLVENFVHQRGLARSGNSCDDSHQSNGKRNVDVLQIVFGRAANHDRLVIGLAALCRNRNFEASGQILAVRLASFAQWLQGLRPPRGVHLPFRRPARDR